VVICSVVSPPFESCARAPFLTDVLASFAIGCNLSLVGSGKLIPGGPIRGGGPVDVWSEGVGALLRATSPVSARLLSCFSS
jgi:hypothetical protein